MIVAVMVVLLLVGAAPALGGDAAAAERQYRLARRLAAEGSPEAGAALRRVVELDPEGPLADDALVDEALLEPVPRWPEEIGRIEILSARKALELLDRALGREPAGDRIEEARYYRGLLKLEPLPGHDPSAARLELTAVALSKTPTPWAGRARYAVGWLHELELEDDRALAAYQRLVVDHPDGEMGARGRVGMGRMLIRRGDHGAAARWLQEAVEAGVPESTGVRRLRELAVRRLMHGAAGIGTSEGSVFATGMRSAATLAAMPDGGALLTDVKQGRVVELDAGGVLAGEWTLEDLQAAAVDFRGRRYAAAGDSVYRLEPAGRTVELTALGDYAPVSALAVDGACGFWLLDRRGRRLGRVDPGSPGPRTFWEGEGRRLGAITWDGRRLVALDVRQRDLVTFDASGRPEVLRAEVGARPLAVAADPSGMLALVDGKTRQLVCFAADGMDFSTVDLPEIDRPVAVGVDAEGGIHVLDGSNGNWTAWR